MASELVLEKKWQNLLKQKSLNLTEKASAS